MGVRVPVWAAAGLMLLASGASAQSGTAAQGGDEVLKAADLQFIRLPQADDFRARHPEQAKRKGVNGQAAVLCVVDDAHRFGDCRVLSEQPAGYGFGTATAELAKIVRVWPNAKDGTPVKGRSVVFPVRWTMRGGRFPEESPSPSTLEPASPD